MATRMQQRRGTAAQWISTNNGDGPILEAGEIGFETDTGKFKIGDGQNHWVDLDYFLDESDITGITGDYVLANTLGQANGVATLDSSGKLTGSQIPGIDELAQDAVDLALVAGTGITKNYNDGANTITIAVDTSVIATKAELAEVSQDSINDALTAGTGITKSYNDNANTITLAVDTATIQARVADVSDTEIGYLANVTSDIQTQLNSKASSTDLSNHASDTTDIHGIANTAELATKEFAANLLVNASKTNITITGNKDGLTITAENGVADSNTDNLIEGSTNLYFTNERAQDAVGNVVGTGLSYDDNTGAISASNVPNSSLANSAVTINGFAISLGGSATYSSDNIGEGTENLYFTNARSRATVSGGTGLDYNPSTGVFDIDSTVTTNTGNQTLINKNIDLANNTVTGTAAQFNSALSDANFVTTADTGTVTSAMIADEAIVNADISNTAAIAQSKIDGLTTDLAAKAALAGATFTGNVVVQQNLQVDGNFTVNGSNVLVSATQIQIEDNLLQIAHQNPNNIVDLGLVTGYNDGTAKHAGLVKDISDSGKWKLFKGVTTEPATTVDFTQATLDDLVVGGLEASSLTVGNVSNTEFGYLANVTSDIQSQIDGKISASSTDTLLNKTVNLANNTVSGTVAEFNSALSDANFVTTADTGTVTSTMIADGTIVNADINASAAIALSKLASGTSGQIIVANSSGVPTWVSESGDITISDTGVTAISSGVIVNADINASAAIDKTKISGTAITAADTGTVTSTMIADGTIVNADINASAAIAQSKIANLTTDLAAKAPLASPTFTGTVTLPSTTSIGNISSTEIGYLDGVTSAIQTQINSKLTGSVSTGATTLNLHTLVTGGDGLIGVYFRNSLNTELQLTVPYLGSFTGNAFTTLDTIPIGSNFTLVTDEPEFGTMTTVLTKVSNGTFDPVNKIYTMDVTYISGDANNFNPATLFFRHATTSTISYTDASLGTSGKYLTNNGTSTSWATIDAISASSTDTLLNKTVNLANNTVSGTIAQFNTALSDANFATLAGTETLSGKTLANATVTGTLTANSSVGSVGQYLESTGSGVRWTSVSGYSAPTIGSTLISSGSTVSSLADVIIKGFEEDVNVVASAATGTINFDVSTASVWYYTSNATANHTINFRYSSSVSLNTALAVGDAITLVWMNTNGTTAYYPNVIQIDGVTVTPRAPFTINAGNASSIDSYTFTIIKTAATPTYTVLETQTKFA